MKKTMVRIMLVCSAAVLALGLAACGGNGASDNGSGSASGGSAPASSGGSGSGSQAQGPFTSADYGTYVITAVSGETYAGVDDAQLKHAAEGLREDDYYRIEVAAAPVLFYKGESLGTFTLKPAGNTYELVLDDSVLRGEFADLKLSFANGAITLDKGNGNIVLTMTRG